MYQMSLASSIGHHASFHLPHDVRLALLISPHSSHSQLCQHSGPTITSVVRAYFGAKETYSLRADYLLTALSPLF